MTHALASSTHRGLRAGLPYAAFAAVVATALISSVGIASSSFMERGHARASALAAHASGAVDAPTGVVRAASRSRCTGCGVVEAIEPLQAVADRPAQFRFTVRMRDGSMRVSRSTGRAQWIVGDRIMLMGGAHTD